MAALRSLDWAGTGKDWTAIMGNDAWAERLCVCVCKSQVSVGEGGKDATRLGNRPWGLAWFSPRGWSLAFWGLFFFLQLLFLGIGIWHIIYENFGIRKKKRENVGKGM